MFLFDDNEKLSFCGQVLIRNLINTPYIAQAKYIIMQINHMICRKRGVFGHTTAQHLAMFLIVLIVFPPTAVWEPKCIKNPKEGDKSNRRLVHQVESGEMGNRKIH